MKNYEVIKKGYRNNVRKQEIVEALSFNEMKPTLN